MDSGNIKHTKAQTQTHTQNINHNTALFFYYQTNFLMLVRFHQTLFQVSIAIIHSTLL